MGAGIGVDRFALFRISLQLPETPPGGGEPERPARRLTLATGPAGPHQHAAPPDPKAPDATAGLLGGAAMVVAAAGIDLVLLRRRAGHVWRSAPD
ncbi:hypothetical protein [Mycobacterium helveticum]|uniref:Uncharacterized protein n=1 Tax=Mycobacterium helveticum TaxID=2592811 RepID=A0A557WX35_9MYCO|nr:hypothetical protein [Mycobacterium helveticum]TVS77822.1 hypothetical protein FPZ47_26205 [Mycobacterium helveticum]TVS77931.1 hypothetical protein FPZ46_24410 [Mycobacterium helveticum]